MIPLFGCLPNLFLLLLGFPAFPGMPDKECKLVALNEGHVYGYTVYIRLACQLHISIKACLHLKCSRSCDCNEFWSFEALLLYCAVDLFVDTMGVYNCE